MKTESVFAFGLVAFGFLGIGPGQTMRLVLPVPTLFLAVGIIGTIVGGLGFRVTAPRRAR